MIIYKILEYYRGTLQILQLRQNIVSELFRKTLHKKTSNRIISYL